ncbi:hypothetical protein HDU98_004808 [Podochytrium sp. JEL0797]|nr:hypothetical protein HDU98_004808 [Podochytrium sp. JEL0797]
MSNNTPNACHRPRDSSEEPAQPSQDSGDENDPQHSAEAGRRRQAFRFNAHIDLVLLKEVGNVEPYRAPHGQTTQRWKDVAANVNMINEADSERADKKRKKEKDEEIRETNSAKIRNAAVKKLKSKNVTPKKANDSDASDDEPDVPSSTPVRARSGPAQLVDTIGSMADMIKESNEADLVAAAEEREERRKAREEESKVREEDRKAREEERMEARRAREDHLALRQREMDLEERKLELEEKKMEWMMKNAMKEN